MNGEPEYIKFEDLQKGKEFPGVLPQSMKCSAGDYLIFIGRHTFQPCPQRYADAIALTASNVGTVLVKKL